MTTTKLKNIITKRISEVKDVEILNKINHLLEANNHSNETYQLNEIQRKKINKSRQEFKENKRLTNEKVIDDIERWLKGK